MKASDAKRLRELEAENLKLKRLLGEAELYKAALKELVEGEPMTGNVITTMLDLAIHLAKNRL